MKVVNVLAQVSGSNKELAIKRPRHTIDLFLVSFLLTSQPAFTCSKLTMETLEQVVKYVKS